MEIEIHIAQLHYPLDKIHLLLNILYGNRDSYSAITLHDKIDS